MKYIYALAAGVALCSAQANATVVTFDHDTPVNDGISGTLSYGGLDFLDTYYEGVWGDNRPNANNGTPGFIYGGYSLTILKSGGGSFYLSNLDIGTSYYSPANVTISYILVLGAGETESGTLDLTDSFTNFAFNKTIDWIILGGTENYQVIDNVDYSASSPAPEAASWIMMLGGFGLIGGAMRSRRKAAVTFG